ncbi:MAG: hypothetical protein ACJAS1_002512 [Oleiphilaceae bacterium]|jgi:hypothetical protein
MSSISKNHCSYHGVSAQEAFENNRQKKQQALRTRPNEKDPVKQCVLFFSEG